MICLEGWVVVLINFFGLLCFVGFQLHISLSRLTTDNIVSIPLDHRLNQGRSFPYLKEVATGIAVPFVG